MQIRRRGPRAFGADAVALMRHHLTARGLGEIAIVTQWSAIAGPALAAHCVPIKLTGKADDGAQLTLIADDRAALELQHQTPKLIDKINTYFGRAIVKKIKIIAGDIPQPMRPPPPPPPLTPAQERDLASATASIEDPQLREAITRLARQALPRRTRGPVIR